MKKLLLILLCALPVIVWAQTDTSKVQYCIVKATGKILSNKVTIEVDYGQEQKFFSLKDKAGIRDDAGLLKNFNSVIDALNYMSSKGWKVIQAYIITEGGGSLGAGQNVYNYLMERKQ